MPEWMELPEFQQYPWRAMPESSREAWSAERGVLSSGLIPGGLPSAREIVEQLARSGMCPWAVFLLRYGQAYEAPEPPEPDEMFFAGRCYENSHRLAQGALRYVEGIVVTPYMPVVHAWNARTGRNARVVDTSLWYGHHCSYWGVEFPFGIVHEALVRVGMFGIFAHWDLCAQSITDFFRMEA